MSILGKISSRFEEEATRINLRFFALSVPVITLILSLLEFNPDFNIWILEALRNLVLTLMITFFLFLFSTLFRLEKIHFNFPFFIKILVTSAGSGVIGGFLAWKINEILFGFNITHPVFFFILTSSLALIFGLSIFAYASLVYKLRETAVKLKEKELDQERLRRLKIQAELEALRAKVNPHFFFNTLNSIASLISIDPPKAEELVERLSRLFRYSLDSSNVEYVDVIDEMEMLEEYLKIEQVRLGDRFSFSIQNNLIGQKCYVPGMLLQPLVENSVIHGIGKISSPGKIELFFEKTGSDLLIQIRDNGRGFEPGKVNYGFGIKGVMDRLNLLYADNHEFLIDSGSGVNISIKIPIINS